ncbi:EcsC family protein [Jeotgalibacillus soli]|nr:EcsC family protein [Jeotgalibacillus soli]
MAWTARDVVVHNQIKEWRAEIGNYGGHDVAHTFSRWLDSSFLAIPEQVKEEFFSRLDISLFHLHNVIQDTHLHRDARERLITTAKTFEESIATLQDFHQLRIDQLHYMALQQSGRHKLYSFVQGGIAGTGGLLAFSTDFLAMALLNIRAIQFIAAAYGRDVQMPYEMTLSLKVFHAATMPPRFQAKAWDDLVQALDRQELNYFYSGDDRLTDEKWLEELIKQLMKSYAISIFRKKKVSDLPILSMAIGAGVNYLLTRRVTEFAERFYQYRYLLDKQ